LELCRDIGAKKILKILPDVPLKGMTKTEGVQQRCYYSTALAL
jgi:hypothetical protein